MRQTAWIPHQFAVVGKTLKIEGFDGWKVEEVWTVMEEEDLFQYERDHLKQRKASDI
jgi:hypothetical protein